MRILLGTVLTLLALAPPCRAQAERDLAYGTDPAQRLDLWLPAGRGFPTIIFVHGGSLTSGDKADDDYRSVCLPFPAEGIACANINYRLGPRHRFPAQPEDVAAAIALVRTRVESRGGDPRKLFLLGHSSGATLVALVGADTTYLARYGMKPGDLAGVIAMGSIMWNDDLEQAIARRGRAAVAEAVARDQDYATFGDLDAYENYWPIHHIGHGMPPYLFLIAEAEQMNPPVLRTNQRFVELTRDKGNAASYRVLAGREHYTAIRRLNEPDDPVFILIRDWIRHPGE